MLNKFLKNKRYSGVSENEAGHKFGKYLRRSALTRNKSAVQLTSSKSREKMFQTGPRETSKNQRKRPSVYKPNQKKSKSQNLQPAMRTKNRLRSPAVGFLKKKSGYQKGDIIEDDYKVVRVLGQGCYGKVYLVKSICKNKHYALKTIPLDSISTNEKFRNLEVRALKIFIF